MPVSSIRQERQQSSWFDSIDPFNYLSTYLSSVSKEFHDFFQTLFLPFFNLLSVFDIRPHLKSLFGLAGQFISSPTTHRSLLGSLLLSFIFCSSILISVIAYVSFYWAYVPQIGLSIPLWLQYGEGKVPYAMADLSNLADPIAIDQAYDVSLHLTVPVNERNIELGNFMVRLNLKTAPPQNITLHRISRHSSLIHQPRFARALDTIKYLRTLFFLSAPRLVQHLDINLFSQKVINPSSLAKKGGLALAEIQIGRDDVYDSTITLAHAKGWGELHIYDATLVFEAHLEGLRALMYYHPYVSFFMFCTLFMIAEFTSVLCTWGLVAARKAQMKQPDQFSIKKEDSSDFMLTSTTSSPLLQGIDDLSDVDNQPISTGRRGMSDIDELPAPDEDHRAVDDEDDQKPELGISRLTEIIKTELPDDELVGGSETTGASGTRSFGSGLSRSSLGQTASSSTS
ncbi:putative adipose-regulatory protein-domain-containing protein [Melampsora americana]|nr:putative adipose-regulatory protein-domain-containing protein [Melampsora americana]